MELGISRICSRSWEKRFVKCITNGLFGNTHDGRNFMGFEIFVKAEHNHFELALGKLLKYMGQSVG